MVDSTATRFQMEAEDKTEEEWISAQRKWQQAERLPLVQDAENIKALGYLIENMLTEKRARVAALREKPHSAREYELKAEEAFVNELENILTNGVDTYLTNGRDVVDFSPFLITALQPNPETQEEYLHVREAIIKSLEERQQRLHTLTQEQENNWSAEKHVDIRILKAQIFELEDYLKPGKIQEMNSGSLKNWKNFLGEMVTKDFEAESEQREKFDFGKQRLAHQERRQEKTLEERISEELRKIPRQELCTLTGKSLGKIPEARALKKSKAIETLRKEQDRAWQSGLAEMTVAEFATWSADTGRVEQLGENFTKEKERREQRIAKRNLIAGQQLERMPVQKLWTITSKELDDLSHKLQIQRDELHIIWEQKFREKQLAWEGPIDSFRKKASEIFLEQKTTPEDLGHLAADEGVPVEIVEEIWKEMHHGKGAGVSLDLAHVPSDLVLTAGKLTGILDTPGLNTIATIEKIKADWKSATTQEETTKGFEQLYELSEQLGKSGNSAMQGFVLMEYGKFLGMAGKPEEGIPALNKAISLFEDNSRNDYLINGLRALYSNTISAMLLSENKHEESHARSLQQQLKPLRERIAAASYVRSSNYPINKAAYRVEQGQIGFSDNAPIGTDNVRDCICLVIRNPKTNKTALAHIDSACTVSSLERIIDRMLPESAGVRLEAKIAGAVNPQSDPGAARNLTATLNFLDSKNIKLLSATVKDPEQPSAIVVDPKTFAITQEVPGIPNPDALIAQGKVTLRNWPCALHPVFDLTQSNSYAPILIGPTELSHLPIDKTEKGIYAHWDRSKDESFNDAGLYVHQILAVCEAHKKSVDFVVDKLDAHIQKMREQNPNVVANEGDISAVKKIIEWHEIYVGENAEEANGPLVSFIEKNLISIKNTDGVQTFSFDVEGLKKVQMLPAHFQSLAVPSFLKTTIDSQSRPGPSRVGGGLLESSPQPEITPIRSGEVEESFKKTSDHEPLGICAPPGDFVKTFLPRFNLNDLRSKISVKTVAHKFFKKIGLARASQTSPDGLSGAEIENLQTLYGGSGNAPPIDKNLRTAPDNFAVSPETVVYGKRENGDWLVSVPGRLKSIKVRVLTSQQVAKANLQVGVNAPRFVVANDGPDHKHGRSTSL